MRYISGIAPFVVASSMLGGVGLRAQRGEPRTFDVTSVKESPSGGRTRATTQAGGRLVVTSMPLRVLVRLAYRLPDAQVEGGPSWFDSRRFDITATTNVGLPAAPFEAPLGVFHQMLQALLADRFGLAAHVEKRERPIYTLTRARLDRLGASLRRSTLDCRADVAGAEQRCERTAGPGFINATGATMDQLASALTLRVDRMVVNRTGLDGTYDFDLQFEQNPKGGASTTADGTDAALFTAVREQLGLRLDARRDTVDVLIIDRASLPTAD